MTDDTITSRLNILVALSALSLIMLTIIGLTSFNIGVLTMPAGRQFQPPDQMGRSCEKDEQKHTCTESTDYPASVVEYSDGCEDGEVLHSGSVGYYTCEGDRCVFHETKDCGGRQCLENTDGTGECGECAVLNLEGVDPNAPGPNSVCVDDSGLYVFPSCQGDNAVEEVNCEEDENGRQHCVKKEEDCSDFNLRCVEVDNYPQCIGCVVIEDADIKGSGICIDRNTQETYPKCVGNTVIQSISCVEQDGDERCMPNQKECKAWQRCLMVYSMPAEGQQVTDYSVDCFDGCAQSGSICYSLSGSIDSSAVDEDLYRPRNEYCRDNVRMVNECELQNPTTPGYCVAKEKPCAEGEKCQTKTVKSTSPQGKVYDVTVTECVKIQATTLTNPPTPTSITGTTQPAKPTTTLTGGSSSTTTLRLTPTSVTGSTMIY